MPMQMIDDGSVASSITLFDTTTLDQSQIWQVTAYLWPALVGNVFAGIPSFRISLVTNGVSVDLVRKNTVAASAFFLAALAAGTPPKVLDKLTLRGNQQIVLTFVTGEVVSLASLAAYGYFEMNATDPVPYDFRPLEPTALVTPFNAAPTVLDIALAGAAPVYKTAQLLNADYADVVTLTTNVQGLVGPFDDNSLAVLKFPNGVQMLLNRNSPTGVSPNSALTTLLEDIPLLAPSATNNALQIGFVSPDGTGSLRATAWGHFTRVS